MRTLSTIFAALLLQVATAQVPDWTKYNGNDQELSSTGWIVMGAAAVQYLAIAATGQGRQDFVYATVGTQFGLGVGMHITSFVRRHRINRRSAK